ncbi:MAG: helix-turn-helix domain-containing protein [Solirubrobacterales bacterium]|nr:helix-turn-helix domain-containing protein [Solirubrobacterales bacterium]
MDVPARPEDPLAQPTRARVFELLRELRRPASTDELAERLGLHPNGVRLHLDRLRDEELVTRERERASRGRPRDLWLISPGARPGGEPPTAYAQLGRWLARAITPGPTSMRNVESIGRQIGRELAPRAATRPERRLHATLAALGFAPRRESRVPGRLTYRLGNCPYRDAVRENPQVVCGLHRGMTRGLLDELDPTGTLTGFAPDDPATAGCLIELEGRLATEGLERLQDVGTS